MRIHILSTPCDIISFNGQGQLCPLTCAEWRDLSNHTRMSTIQSRTPEKKAKNHVTLTWKFPWKSCSTAQLPFLSPNPKILKAFLKTFSTKMKPTKCPAIEKEMMQEKQKKRVEEKGKSKSQDCCVRAQIPYHSSAEPNYLLLNGFSFRPLFYKVWLWSNRFIT